MSRDPGIPEALLQPAPAAFHRALGSVCIAVGAGFALLGLAALWLIVGADKPVGDVKLWLAPLPFVMAWALFAAGLKLKRGPLSKNESFLPALAWYALCALFVTLAVFFVWVAVAKGSSPGFIWADQGIGVCSALFLALLCYGAGWHAKRRQAAHPVTR